MRRIVTVHIAGCKDLFDRDAAGMVDSYVSASYGQPLKKFKTPRREDTVNPSWSASEGSFTVTVESDSKQMVEFCVFDQKMLQEEEFLGQVTWSPSECEPKGSAALELRPRKEESDEDIKSLPSGKLGILMVNWTSEQEGPRPPLRRKESVASMKSGQRTGVTSSSEPFEDFFDDFLMSAWKTVNLARTTSADHEAAWRQLSTAVGVDESDEAANLALQPGVLQFLNGFLPGIAAHAAGSTRASAKLFASVKRALALWMQSVPKEIVVAAINDFKALWEREIKKVSASQLHEEWAKSVVKKALDSVEAPVGHQPSKVHSKPHPKGTSDPTQHNKESREMTFPHIGLTLQQSGHPPILSVLSVSGVAAEAGVRPGSVLVQINGTLITATNLREVLSRQTSRRQEVVVTFREQEGDGEGHAPVYLPHCMLSTWLRDGKLRKGWMTRYAAPPIRSPSPSPQRTRPQEATEPLGTAFPDQGFSLLASPAVHVTDVVANGLAATLGLQVGAKLTHINGVLLSDTVQMARGVLSRASRNTPEIPFTFLNPAEGAQHVSLMMSHVQFSTWLRDGRLRKKWEGLRNLDPCSHEWGGSRVRGGQVSSEGYRNLGPCSHDWAYGLRGEDRSSEVGNPITQSPSPSRKCSPGKKKRKAKIKPAFFEDVGLTLLLANGDPDSVRVTEVTVDSIGDRAGIRTGATLTQVQGVPVSGKKQLRSVLTRASALPSHIPITFSFAGDASHSTVSMSHQELSHWLRNGVLPTRWSGIRNVDKGSAAWAGSRVKRALFSGTPAAPGLRKAYPQQQARPAPVGLPVAPGTILRTLRNLPQQ